MQQNIVATCLVSSASKCLSYNTLWFFSKEDRSTTNWSTDWLIDWFKWHINPLRIFLCQELSESRSFEVLCKVASKKFLLIHIFYTWSFTIRFLFDRLMGPRQVLPLQLKVDLRVMEMKKYSTFSRSPEQNLTMWYSLVPYPELFTFWLTVMYLVHLISFQIFVQAFKIVVDTWKFSMLLLYLL